MSALPGPPLFKLLNKSSTPLAQQIEATYTYNSSHINTHFMGVKSQMGLPQWIPFSKPVKGRILTVTADPVYIKEMLVVVFTQ